MKEIALFFFTSVLFVGCTSHSLVQPEHQTWLWYNGTNYGAFGNWFRPAEVDFQIADSSIWASNIKAGGGRFSIKGVIFNDSLDLKFVGYSVRPDTVWHEWRDTLRFVTKDSIFGLHMVPDRNTPVFDVFRRKH